MKKLSSPSYDEALALLGFDPSAVLLRDPAVVMEPRYLSSLHTELREEFGAVEAAATLTQIGFLHGMRDAHIAIARAFAHHRMEGDATASPPLAMQFQPTATPAAPGSLELQGRWPACPEAAGLIHASVEMGGGPACHVSAGYSSGWFSAHYDTDILVVESTCSAAGDDACRFVARETTRWQSEGTDRVRELLERLPFAAFRELIEREQPETELIDASAFDPESAVVHIWGPVMVIPFSGPDEAMEAVGMIGRDPSAQHVSVVIVDLTGAVLDHAFGAVALERIVEIVESWGAEAVFAGVGPMSEGVVAELERTPLMVQKDLNEAIASGFRIAASQRRSV